VLSPVVLGMTYLISTRIIENAREWEFPSIPAAPVAFGAVVLLLSASLSRAASEIFAIGHPRAHFDALPLSIDAQLRAAVLIRIARSLIVTAVLLLIRWRLGVEVAGVLIPTLCFVALISISELLAAINWIHLKHKRDGLAALSTLAALIPAIAVSSSIFTELLSTSAGRWRPALTAAGFIWALLIYAVLKSCNRRWRAGDIDYARRLLTSRRRASLSSPLLRWRLNASAGAQLTRDLRLTLRGFSSAVYAALGIAFLLLASEFLLINSGRFPLFFKIEGWLDLAWLPASMAAKFGCVTACVSLTSILPILVGHELPHMWLERAAGTTGLDIFQAKLRYARLIAIPAPFIAWIVAIITGQVPSSYAAPLLGECLLLWLLVSSFIGAMSFEIPERTGLALLMMSLTGLAVGFLTAFMWPIGLVVLGMAGHTFTERGRMRARYFLLKGAD